MGTKSPILEVQTLLHLSHGHAVPVMLTTWCSRAARLLSNASTRWLFEAMADWHTKRHWTRSNRDLLSDLESRPAFFRLIMTVSLKRLTADVCLITVARRKFFFAYVWIRWHKTWRILEARHIQHLQFQPYPTDPNKEVTHWIQPFFRYKTTIKWRHAASFIPTLQRHY